MSKAAEHLEKYLFFKHNLIAIDLLNVDLELLDVLVKKGSHGLVRDRGPTIVKIGSICSLRSNDDINPKWEEWANHAKDSLRSLRQNEELETDHELFSTGLQGDYECTTQSTSGVLFSLSKFLGIGGDRSKSWSWSAQNVTYEKFSNDLAADLFYGRDSALWKPDLQRIKLEEPSLRWWDGALELWVVKEIKYAQKIKITTSSEYEAHGGVDLATAAAAAGIPIPLPGGTLQVEAKVGKAKDAATLEVTGRKVPFAFKAIRLVYKDGFLVAKHSDMGLKLRPKPIPYYQGRISRCQEEEEEEEEVKSDDQEEEVKSDDQEEEEEEEEVKSDDQEEEVNPSYFFDVDQDPSYHMGGFFLGGQFLGVVTNGGGPLG